MKAYIVGGNLTSRLRKILGDLGIGDFVHAQLNITSIDPVEMKRSADYLTQVLAGADVIFSTSAFADRVLKVSHLHYTSLPDDKCTPNEVQARLDHCKQYLIQRSYLYAPTIHPTGPAIS